MYSALRNAQSEMNNMLLKFGEEVIAKSTPPETTRSIDPGILQQRDQDAFDSIQSSMDAQFTALASMIERLNGTMTKIVNLLEKQSESKDKGIVVSMDQTIPNLQQYSQPQDLRTIRVEHTATPVVAPTVTLPSFNDEEEVEVEELERCGQHQVTPPGEDAAGLRAPQRLAARKGHEVCAFRNEAPEIVLRRQLRRGVDDHRNPPGMGDGRHLG
jgi:hypothetical protein